MTGEGNPMETLSVPRAKTRRREATRRAMLSASRRLFSRKGFEATSIDAIAEEVGVTKGALYWHFENKEALFEGILEQIRTDWREQVLAEVDDVADPVEKLGRLFDNYIVLLNDRPDICLFLQRAALDDDAKHRGRVRTVYKQTAGLITKIIDDGKLTGVFRRDIESNTAAHAILGVLTGAEQQCRANKALSFRDLVSEMKKALIRGLSVSM